MSKLFVITLLGLSLLLAPLAQGGAAEVPSQRGYVSDYAEIIDAKTELAVGLLSGALEDRHGSKLVILTVESTSPLGLADYSEAVFKEWGLSPDDLLFLIAVQDGKVRLEPGARLSRSLTDEKLQEIMEREIMPQFRAGNFSQGVLRGAVALASAIKEIKKRQAQERMILWLGLALGLVVLIAAGAAILLLRG
ncbi:MAG: TPM domain-containing protein [Candidatus Bipolaricaulia bacterium]